MQADDVTTRDRNAWVRLPLATLNGLLDERFKNLEQETHQLRLELAQTHAALSTVQTGLVRMSAEIQRQQALGNEQLRSEIKQITAALAGLKDGATVTLRTHEVTFSPKPPAPTNEPAALQLGAGSAVVDGSIGAPSRPRATNAPPPAAGFKKPTYASPPPPPPARSTAQAQSQPARAQASATRAAETPARTAQPLPPSAAKVRSLSDRLLKMLGVAPPRS